MNPPHEDDTMTSHPANASTLGGVPVGPGNPVRVMAILNASPESFYQGSIASGSDSAARAAAEAEAAGADILDIGAMSTAPYKDAAIDEKTERERMEAAVSAARAACGLVISADTSRASVARAAIDAGATVINDVHGLERDPELGRVVASAGVDVVLMANEAQLAPGAPGDPAGAVEHLWQQALSRAREADIPDQRIVLDPGIGFFRNRAEPWDVWDMAILRALPRLAGGRHPVLVSASRKSFLGKLLGLPDSNDRLAPSIAAALWCARSGVRVIRTHDPRETRDALALWRMLDEPPTQ